MRLLKAAAVIIAIAIPIIAIPYFFSASAGFLYDKADPRDRTVEVYDVEKGEKVTMSLFDYLCGAVAAEMPALYGDEALKAQAVACRTYYEKRAAAGGSDAHDGAAVCTSSSHCSAFLSEERQKQRWGEKYDLYRKKIENAVSAVMNKIITYNGAPIDAVYFSRSSGKTENASDVWGKNVPYLVSVDSSVDAGDGLEKTVSFTADEFSEKLLSKYPSADISDLSASVNSRDGAGYVASLTLCGVSMTGREAKSLFSLPSADFDITTAENGAVFTVRGKGHGVGMSQYGANVMASLGYGFEDIIKHYYTGVEITDV